MINEVVLMRVFNGKTFGRNEAASIVGGLRRLETLIAEGKIRAEKKNSAQNGKWRCNAWDCLKNAMVR